MSIEVPVKDLPLTVAQCGWCFVVTSGAAGAHILSLSPSWDAAGDALFSARSGRLSSNVGETGAATMVFPPFASGELEGYSLIVDVSASITDDGELCCRPLRAVWHRPAPPATR